MNDWTNESRAHHFVVTARVRAAETLANTGVGRVCTLDEFKAVTTITFDYPPKFQVFVQPAELDRYREAGLTGRSVAFSTTLTGEGGEYGRIVFVRNGEPPWILAVTLKRELGADVLAKQVVEFLARNKDPEFPATMVVPESAAQDK